MPDQHQPDQTSKARPTIQSQTNLSTHILVHYGAFMCQNCANNHVNIFGFWKTYPKSIMDEQFDDYQLAAICDQIGGNKPIYDLFVEYQIQNEIRFNRFNHMAFNWHKRKLSALTIGKPFDEKKPAKCLEEFWDNSVEKGKKKYEDAVNEVK